MERYGMLLSALVAAAAIVLGVFLLRGRSGDGEALRPRTSVTAATPAAGEVGSYASELSTAAARSTAEVATGANSLQNNATAAQIVAARTVIPTAPAGQADVPQALRRGVGILFRERPSTTSEADVDRAFEALGIAPSKTQETISLGEKRITWRGTPQGFPDGAYTVRMRNFTPGAPVLFESATLALPVGDLTLQKAAAVLRAEFPEAPLSESVHATAVTWKFSDSRSVWLEQADLHSSLRIGIETATE